MLHAEWQKSHDSHEIKVETMTVSNWITFDYFFCRFVSLKTRETKSERIRISIIYVKKNGHSLAMKKNDIDEILWAVIIIMSDVAPSEFDSLMMCDSSTNHGVRST